MNSLLSILGSTATNIMERRLCMDVEIENHRSCALMSIHAAISQDNYVLSDACQILDARHSIIVTVTKQ